MSTLKFLIVAQIESAYPAKVAKTYHHGDLREQLLNAGEQVLGEMPVEKVTLREIARRAGVSHAAPKHHFPTLGILMGEIAARGFQRFIVALGLAAAATADQSPRSRLFAMGHAYLKFASNHAATYQLMFGQRESMAMTPNLIAASEAAWQQLVGEATPIVGPAKANAAALYIWSTVHGFANLKLAGRVPLDLPQSMEEQMLELLWEGLDRHE